MTTSADILVLGAGAIGASIACHLAQSGKANVAVVERNGIADGTTWHSAGMVGQLRAKPEIMQVIGRSAAVYAAMEALLPGSAGFQKVGSLRLAATAERLDEMARQVKLACSLGIEAHIITVSEIKKLAPIIDPAGLVGGAWLPDDGYCDPEQLANGLMAAAIRHGARLVTGAAVTALQHRPDGSWLAETAAETFHAGKLVLACGFKTPILAAMAGVFVPMLVSRQQLIFSGAIDPSVALTPTIREPDKSLIMRPRGDTLVVGSYAPNPEFDEPAAIPDRPRFLYDPEPGRMEPAWEAAVERFPDLAVVGQSKVLKGPEGVTPDGEIILGPAGPANLWIAAGGSGHGIASAGGAGWMLAEWLLTGTPPVNPAPFALQRFPPSYATDKAAMLAETARNEIGHYALAGAK